MSEPELRILDRASVEMCVAAFDPVDVVESVLRAHTDGASVLPAEAYMEWNNQTQSSCRSIAMPGGLSTATGPVYGLKVINAAISNPDVGLDRAGGVVMLFDPDTARPVLLADAGYLSGLRTAAYTLLSLRHLGPRSCPAVSIIGCGALAREHLRLLEQHYPELSTVYVHDRDPERAEALETWAGEYIPGLSIIPGSDVREVIGASNVLITLTTSRRPYIERDWLRPATFIAHVSLDDVTEDVFVGADAVFVDDVALVEENPRRILGRLMAQGTMAEPGAGAGRIGGGGSGRAITGTLGEVLTGRCPAVRPEDGGVVSNPFGMSILDLGLLHRVALIADAAGLGQSLPVFGATAGT